MEMITMLWPAILLLPLCFALPPQYGHDRAPAIRQLYEFPNGTWIENIAVRANGKLLVTLESSPQVYQIDPLQQNPTPKLVAQFSDHDTRAVLGIAEIEEDVFAISKGNLSISKLIYEPDSFSVWKADLRKQEKAVLSKIADMPEASFLNGITTVKKGSDYILLADSLGGAVWRLNVRSSKYNVVLNTTATQPIGSIFEGGFGVNGVHTRDGALYFTNSNKGFYRVRINEDGTTAGEVETLLPNHPNGDDFTFDPNGNVYLARGPNDALENITPGGKVTALQFQNGDARVLLAGSTAAAFGRTQQDRQTLYVTTNGGETGQVEGTPQQGGRLLAIDLDGHDCPWRRC